MFDIPCVILAGGKSSRMKEDKCFLLYKNTTLIQYQYNRLKKLFPKVYISSKTNKFDFECDLILDHEDDYSPLIALDSIIKNIYENKFFLITVDTPNVSLNSIEKIIQNSKNYDINIASTNNNKHNLCGIFSSNIKEQIQIMLKNGNHKISELISKVNSTNTFIKDENEFINLNTKEDYQKLI